MKIGVIGAGMISDIYLQNMITRFDNLQVVGISARHLSNAQKKADQYGIAAMTTQEMLDNREIELIVNLTPPTVHKEIIAQALRAGKHVYTEKVIALSYSDAAELMELSRNTGKCLCSAPDTFLGASLQTARELIDRGELGTITAFHAQVSRQMEYFYQFLDFTREPGGGIGYDLGIYYLTALLSLLGPAKEVSGSIMTSRPVRQFYDKNSPRYGQSYQIQNENLMVATVRMHNDIMGTLHFNGDAVMPEASTLLLEGTKAVLYLGNPDLFGENLRLFKAGDFHARPQNFTEEIKITGAYADNSRGLGVSEMVDALENGRRPRTDCSMGVHALELLDGIAESSRIGKSVQLSSTFERPLPLKV